MLKALTAFRPSAPSLLLPVCLVLLLQTAVSHVVSMPERNLPLPDLHGLPPALGTWQEQGEHDLGVNTTEYLHPDEYILRDYVDQAKGASMNVFVAYFKSLQGKYRPHSPSVCLPGAGWLVRSSKMTTIEGPAGSQTVPVNEYILEKSGNRILVMFWYQNERDIWADEFWEKIRLLPDLIRYRRSDVSLVRLISPTTTNGNDFTNCAQFARVLLPVLEKHFEAAR